MLRINFLAVGVTTLAAFMFSSVWYIVFGKARMKLLGNDEGATADVRRVPTWKKLFELVHTFVVTLVIAHACNRACWDRRLAGRGAAWHLDRDRVSGYDPRGFRHVGQTAMAARRHSRW